MVRLQAVSSLELVAPVDPVVAGVGVDRVVAALAAHHVVSGAGVNLVVTRAGQDLVVALAGRDDVLAAAPVDLVVAATRVDGVVATAPGGREGRLARLALEPIVAVVAGEEAPRRGEVARAARTVAPFQAERAGRPFQPATCAKSA